MTEETRQLLDALTRSFGRKADELNDARLDQHEYLSEQERARLQMRCCIMRDVAAALESASHGA